MANQFPFAHDTDSVAFCCRIRDAMVRFCGVDAATAEQMMRAYWGDVADIASDPLFFGEPAYYYAMCVAHHPTIGDNDPEWYRRPELWPPPSGWTTSRRARAAQHGFYDRPSAHCCRLFKPPFVGTIGRISNIVRFGQGGVVKTSR